MKNKYTCENDKVRLDKFLVEILPEFSRSKIQDLIENRNISVNNTIVETNHFWLYKEDEIEILSKKFKKEDLAEPKNLELFKKIKIIEDADDYVVLEKPAGVLVHRTKDLIKMFQVL